MNNKMAKNTYLSRIDLKNKLSKQEEQGQNHGYGECFDSSRWEAGVGERVKR